MPPTPPMPPAYCYNCGNLQDANLEFCSSCGSGVTAEPQRKAGTATSDLSGVKINPDQTYASNIAVSNTANSTVGNAQNIRSTNWTIIAAIGVVSGIIILMVGVGMIQISPNFVYQQKGGAISIGGIRTTEHFIETVTVYETLAYFGGILLVFVGVVGTVVGGLLFITQTMKPLSSTAQHRISQPPSARSIELGDSPDKVQRVMGNPEKIIDLHTQVIHIYKDMKIIYVNGTVSDVQLS